MTGEEKYQKAAGVLRKQLSEQPRTPEGAFWHKKRYSQQAWLDGAYMALPFYASYAVELEDSSDTVMTDIGKQFQLFWTHARDNKTGLLRHGYDWSKKAAWADPVTGASSEVWNRVSSWTTSLLPLSSSRLVKLIPV